MIFRKIDISEKDKLAAMYEAVLVQQEKDEYGPKWTRGIYPCDIDYISHTEKGEYYGGFETEKLACAAVLTFSEDDMYKVDNWEKKTSEDKVAVIHLFAIAPDYRRQGVSKAFLKYLLKEAEKHAETVHLDVLAGNLPASRLYLSVGFRYAGNIRAYYEDIGDCELELYEYDLENEMHMD